MKKIFIVALLLALPVMANADPVLQDDPKPENAFGAGPGVGDRRRGGGFMKHLTETQKKCLEEQDCPKYERKPKGEKPEMTEEERAAMKEERECLKKAFDTCGIQTPERPAGMVEKAPLPKKTRAVKRFAL